MGLDRRVVFVGSQDNPYPLLSRSAVFALTSRWDPFPIAVLEAMALRIPVVAFRTGSVEEELGGCGILCDPGHVEEMASHVVRMLKEASGGRAMANRAYDRVSALYDVAQFRPRIQGLIRETLPTRAGTNQLE
jgi:glycosyltransferase involved in cell wall biosynthesis